MGKDGQTFLSRSMCTWDVRHRVYFYLTLHSTRPLNAMSCILRLLLQQRHLIRDAGLSQCQSLPVALSV